MGPHAFGPLQYIAVKMNLCYHSSIGDKEEQQIMDLYKLSKCVELFSSRCNSFICEHHKRQVCIDNHKFVERLQ